MLPADARGTFEDEHLMLTGAPTVYLVLQVGTHNAAANSGRLLGDAALKYRLLQARGYLVVPVSCKASAPLRSRDTRVAMALLCMMTSADWLARAWVACYPSL
jgi:hypothetical protein